jgi:Fe-S-cluster containining protein
MNDEEQIEISCATCKALCCRLEVRLIDDADDQVPSKFTEQVDGFYMAMKRGEDGWCQALDRDTMLCSIYEKRPYLCRDYKVGDYDCLEERKKLPFDCK